MTAFLPPVTELSLIAVADAGNKEQERVALRPTQEVDLSAFLLSMGLRSGDGVAAAPMGAPFWFPTIAVAPPAWLLVYTRPWNKDERVVDLDSDGRTVIYKFFWSLSGPAFGGPDIVPVVFRVSGISVGRTEFKSALHNLLASAKIAAGQPSGVRALPSGQVDYAKQITEVSVGVERELSEYLKANGVEVQSVQAQEVTMETLVATGVLAPDLARAIATFWPLRNQVVHGMNVTDEDRKIALEAGMWLAESLQRLNRRELPATSGRLAARPR